MGQNPQVPVSPYAGSGMMGMHQSKGEEEAMRKGGLVVLCAGCVCARACWVCVLRTILVRLCCVGGCTPHMLLSRILTMQPPSSSSPSFSVSMGAHMYAGGMMYVEEKTKRDKESGRERERTRACTRKHVRFVFVLACKCVLVVVLFYQCTHTALLLSFFYVLRTSSFIPFHFSGAG